MTGGARGIGGAVSTLLAEDGATVAVLGLPDDRERAHNLAARLNGAASKIHFYQSDVSIYDECRETVAAVLQEYGRIDFLVNNAGITRDGLMMRMKRADWDDVLGTNLTGAFLLTQALLPAMLRNRWGRIINITSVVGRTGQAGQVNYAASKAGLIGFTRSLAREVASRNVTVNAVAPGYIETPMTAVLDEKQREVMMVQIPLGRAGTDLEIAQSVAFLASHAAAYITGHVLDVNGGMFMGG